MGSLRKLTLLHSNDLHGDFLAREVDKTLLGGTSMLSGYVNKVRHEEENVIYAISGDMFRGSVIDSEYKGLSTIEIMNMIAPDVVTIGNHEVDYGIGHLLFVEKCTNFPIINANMYLTGTTVRMFRSHFIKKINGMRVLFIGVLTDDALVKAKHEILISELIDVRSAAEEVGRICNAYRTEDIDLTVLLTHIGFEADKELAEQLDPKWGVDIIIGGHSHTLMEQPETVNGIPIVQAASGTAQIGRFDIILDTERNCIESYTWELIPINSKNCPRDRDLEKVIRKYKRYTDKKYGRVVTRLADCCTHPARNMETTLGRLLSDAFRDMLGLDIMLLASGSIRGKSLGPIVLYNDLVQILPFNDEIFRIEVTGAQLKTMMTHMLRPEAFTDAHTEFYQLSKGLRVEYDLDKQKMLSLSFNGNEVKNEDTFSVGMQGFHLNNIGDFLNVPYEEIANAKRPVAVATNDLHIVDEYFSSKELHKVSEEQRIVLHGAANTVN